MPLEETRGRVRAELRAHGPRTGAQLHAAVGGAVFALWKACATASDLTLRRVGRRYVRFDRTVEGFARQSPSILREFMTYTVVGETRDEAALEASTRALAARIKVISQTKQRMASRVVGEAFGPLTAEGRVDADSFCALVAGDIVYGMSHDVDRHESSTGLVVEGSDLDVIVLVRDEAAASMPVLDEALLSRKWLYLRNPGFREELDYVVKPLARLREQAAFDSFTHMVACKVFDEARLIFGSASVHAAGRRLLDEASVTQQLRELEFQAAALREDQEAYLLAIPDEVLPTPDEVKFYTNEERGEFEH